MAKSGMRPVYVGDVGNVTPRKPKGTIPAHIDIDKLSFREMCSLAISVGFELRELIGIKTCGEHIGMVLLADRIMPEGMNLFEHCVYCRNCFQLFRIKELKKS